MKKIILPSFFISFIFLFLGIFLILFAAAMHHEIAMYFGLAFIIIGTLGYAILILFGIRYWLIHRNEVE